MMTMLLRKLGYEILIAGNGQEALEALEREAARGKAHEIQCILMDASMDVMDGRCRRLQRNADTCATHTGRTLHSHLRAHACVLRSSVLRHVCACVCVVWFAQAWSAPESFERSSCRRAPDRSSSHSRRM